MNCKQCNKKLEEKGRFLHFYCSKKCRDSWWSKFNVLKSIEFKLDGKTIVKEEKKIKTHKSRKRIPKKRTYNRKAIEDYLDYILWVLPPSKTKEIVISALEIIRDKKPKEKLWDLFKNKN